MKGELIADRAGQMDSVAGADLAVSGRNGTPVSRVIEPGVGVSVCSIRAGVRTSGSLRDVDVLGCCGE